MLKSIENHNFHMIIQTIYAEFYRRNVFVCLYLYKKFLTLKLRLSLNLGLNASLGPDCKYIGLKVEWATALNYCAEGHELIPSRG